MTTSQFWVLQHTGPEKRQTIVVSKGPFDDARAAQYEADEANALERVIGRFYTVVSKLPGDVKPA